MRVFRYVRFTTYTLLGLFLISCQQAISDNNSGNNKKSPESEIQDAIVSTNSDKKLSDAVIDYEGFVKVTNDEIYEKWPQHDRALAPSMHENILKISYVKQFGDNWSWKDSYVKMSGISVEEESYLVFDYRASFFTHCYDENNNYDPNSKPYASEKFCSIEVDGNSVKQIGSMGNSVWRTTGVKLSPNSLHSVKWNLPAYKYRFTSFENAIYIDNIRLVSSREYEKVDLSPKGQQDTYIGNPFKFTATADWSSAAPSYYCSNASINSDGVFYTNTPGTYTIYATIEGKTASTTLTVHESSLPTPVVYLGKTFTGIDPASIKKDTEKYQNYENDMTIYTEQNDPGTPMLCPHDLVNAVEFDFNGLNKCCATFNANGYFDISGTVKDSSNNYYVRVAKIDPQNDKYTYYKLSANFHKRIWLRFGSGEYKVSLCKEYKPGWLSWRDFFFVQNTDDCTLEKGLYTYPSDIVQSDSYEVSNAVHDALDGYQSMSDGVKLQLLYSWIMHHCHYDYVSLDSSKRKPQDAVYTLKSEMAVCEGYADTYAAMARYCGFFAKVIGAHPADNTIGHAWNEIFYDNFWCMADATWDDGRYNPEGAREDNVYNDPYDESYKYFLVDVNDADHAKYNTARGPLSRSAQDSWEFIPPYNHDMPDGWY